tara:strand:+ start:368 stop:1327 length:960 start_codon:yes stop_codon:yes gene_type:complete
MSVQENFYCVAPMMGKTDNFFCYLLELINNKVLIYTEMMHAETIIRTNILENYSILNNIEKVAIQIAGSKPDRLAIAAKKAANFGFNEININCGCPSKRVVSGSFGINLLLQPDLVRECVEEISNKTSKQISIKTRIGVDQYISENILDNFLLELNKANVSKYIIHARVALRKKLNTKENLNIPALNYERVYKLKKKFRNNKIIINGGFKNTKYDNQIIKKIDGIMIGREAYKNPWIFNLDLTYNDLDKKKLIINSYLDFLKNNFKKYLFNKNALFHIQNIFNGYQGSKKWRQNVSSAIKNKDLNNLLKFIDCDNIKLI